MVTLDEVELVQLGTLKEGDLFLAEGKVVVAMQTGFDRTYVDLALAGSAGLPSLKTVLKLRAPVISFDPGSAIPVYDPAPNGALLITTLGPAVYAAPHARGQKGVFFFLNGQIGEYVRSSEPAFSSWSVGVQRGAEIRPIVEVQHRS